MTTPTQTTTPAPRPSTWAQRMRQPLAADVVAAVADQHGVCVRPFTMEVADPETGELRYVPLPCGATIESVCGPCARKAKALRMAQCREGWHLTEEPTPEAEEPTDHQRELVAARADLVQRYHHALAPGCEEDADELRDAIRQADDQLRQLGVRGRLPAPDPPAMRTRKRSTRRRHDAPDLPTRTVRKTTVGQEFAGQYRPSMFVTLTCPSYGRVSVTAPRSTRAVTTIGAPPGTRCTLPPWWTAGGKTCAASSVGMSNTSPPSNRKNALRRTCTPRCAGQSRTR